MVLRSRAGSWMWLLLAGAMLAGCASPRRVPAPVEDRGTVRPVTAPAPAPAAPVVALPGAENAGKPGYFTVRPGDTLIRIALETGQNWRDVARWNNIDNPNVIEVGQVLRVAAPGSLPSDPTYAARPAPPPPPAPAASAALPPASGAASAPARPASAPVVTAAPAPAPPPGPATPPEDEIAWAWPIANGPVLSGFDEQKNKGIDIGGRAGDPVLASADGKVVYAGAGLRGYGNLIILKHNNTYLTAYAHNQTLLVREDQSVRKGQKIAEMGSTDSDRVKLHFEIRRQGKPVDPARYLPAR
ncbi:MAG: peptidase [Ramlibacter sp.]|jgi:lipoprotein NlpD|nr:peptidase [Ramlibacter sp.]